MVKRWTMWLAIIMLIAGLLDVVSTYYATPDLSSEANPVIVALGRTWLSVFAIKIIGSLVSLLLFNWSLRTLDTRRKRLSGLSGFWCVTIHLLYKRQLSVYELLIKGGSMDWGAFLCCIFVGVAMAVVSGGIVASIANSFKLIGSIEGLIAFWLGIAILSTAMGFMLIYRFLSVDNDAEQSGVPATDSDVHA